MVTAIQKDKMMQSGEPNVKKISAEKILQMTQIKHEKQELEET